MARTHRKFGLIPAIAIVVSETRRRAELSQEQLAELAGVDRAYISEIERGLRNISLTVMERVANGLGMPLSLLIHLAEHENSQHETSNGHNGTAKKARARRSTPARRS